MSITLTAANCPPPQVPSGAIWISDNTAEPYTTPNAEPLPAGASSEVMSLWGQNAARIDVQGRLGSGAIAVGYGLVVSDGGGLVANVSAGQALMSGIVEMDDDDTVPLAASATNRIWLKADGTLTVKTDLSVPAGGGAFLGSAITSGSAITMIDTSGVIHMVNGIPERSTADTAKPSDSPDSTWRGWTKTLSGLWWWDGSQYQRLVGDLPFVKDVLADGEAVILPEDHQLIVFDSFTVEAGASLTIQGKLRVIS